LPEVEHWPFTQTNMASPCLKIIWSPDASDANQYLSPQFRDISTITSLNYRQQRLTGMFVTGCNDLTSITAPNCTTIEGHGNTDFLSIEPIQIGFCNALETIDLPALTYLRTGTWITTLPALTTLNLSAIQELDVRVPGGGDWGASIINCDALTSINLSSLSTITTTSLPTSAFLITITGCSSLTTITAPSLPFPNGGKFLFTSNALSQSTVDALLARAVANAGYVSGSINLTGGTNSTPSASGLLDVATLTGRGVTVTHN